MRASPPTRNLAARVAFAALLVVGVLLAAVSAQADPAGRLRAADAGLASKSRAVLLELYGLESQLDRAQRRLASLEEEARGVAQRREAARAQLALVRHTLENAQERLAVRLRQLYIEGDPDPLAVLLGASSLTDAITSLDNLGRFAKQDRDIVSQVRDARAAIQVALANLAAREAELQALVADAKAARSALLAARDESATYLARLLRQRRVNRAELTRLTNQAEHIVSESSAPAAETTVDAEDETSEGGSPSAQPPPVTGSSTTMTVQATGYCLKGTTATGIPAGWGVVAVDPTVIPLGTRMTVPGYGEGVAADTGSAVKGAMIDLWFPSCSQAIAWGRKPVTITLH